MSNDAKPKADCICGEINARHCPVHNEPKQAWEVKMGELVEKHYKTSGWVRTEWAVMNFIAGFTTCRAEMQETHIEKEWVRENTILLVNHNTKVAEMQNEIADLQGYCSEFQDKKIMFEYAIEQLKAELAKRDRVIEKMQKTIELFKISEESSESLNLADHKYLEIIIKRTDAVAREALAEVKKIMGEV